MFFIMRHRVKKKHLSRTAAQRKALYRGLAISLFEHGKIKTTLAKAKGSRPFIERLITIAKKNNLAARRLLLARLYQNRRTAKKLIEEIGPRYAKRPGGYLKIVKLGKRQGDGAEMVRIELVEGNKTKGETVKPAVKKMKAKSREQK